MSGFVNGARSAETRRQLAEIESELADAEAARKYAEERPERERAQQQVEHERRELKKRLLMDPFESHDFNPQKYDGRFSSEKEIVAAIKAAWDEFTQRHELDQQARTTLALFLNLHDGADLTKVEVLEHALAYLEGRLNPPVEVPPAKPTPTPEADPLENLSGRARERKEKELYRHSVLSETLTGNVFSDVVQELCDSTGLSMPTKVQLQFRQFLEARKIPMTRPEIRIAAATYFGETSFLTAEEKEEITSRAYVASCTSEDIRRVVGSRNSFDPAVGGYRAIREGE